MGWGNCGLDSEGRPIGYMFEATCDEPDCEVEIDRGLAFVCGDMHGEDEVSCEKYFCEAHKPGWVEVDENRSIAVCGECEKAFSECELWVEDKEDGVFKQRAD
ncbi:MAG: hypothetical protein KAS32_25045 [Candidatus Peribacteraceae bacterium]|nr:hypothetical protein [Candidatus Peribacteraceae bacterium]